MSPIFRRIVGSALTASLVSVGLTGAGIATAPAASAASAVEEAGMLAVIVMKQQGCKSLTGDIGGARVNLSRDNFLSVSDVSGFVGSSRVALMCNSTPGSTGSGSGASNNSVAKVCVKEQGEPRECEEGATRWTYEGCWQFDGSGSVKLQKRSGGKWKTVDKNVASKDKKACRKAYPWLVEFERKIAPDSRATYRLKFPDGDSRKFVVSRT